jgi:ribonuclease M5
LPLIHIEQAVVVEGKYDKIKLSSIIDALILETGGFKIFKDKELLVLLRALAETRGVLILTDSDAAGFKIRSYLTGALPKGRVRHAYIPDIFGKESRKTEPSKEGKLGVEGVPKQAILECLRKAGVLCEERPAREPLRQISKADLFADGLSGGEGSAERRRALLRELRLPERLSANAMLEVLNAVLGYDGYKRLISRI